MALRRSGRSPARGATDSARAPKPSDDPTLPVRLVVDRDLGTSGASAPAERDAAAGGERTTTGAPAANADAADALHHGEHDREAASLAPAVTRAVRVLDVLAETARSVPLSELARRVGAPKSSVANICAALVDSGLVRRSDAGFALGRRLAELGGAYLSSVDLVGEFHAAIERLPVASEETSQLAILDGLDVTYLARHDGRQPIRLASEIGRRLPASCTALGKATLAALDPDDLADRLRGVEALPTLTRRSHRTVASLLDDLDQVRQRGFAIDDEETAEGVICLAVALDPLRSTGGSYGASVTLLKARADDTRREAIVADLQRLRRLLANPLTPA